MLLFQSKSKIYLSSNKHFHFHFHFYFISKIIGKKQNRYSSWKTPKTTRTQFKKPMIPQYYKEVLNKWRIKNQMNWK